MPVRKMKKKPPAKKTRSTKKENVDRTLKGRARKQKMENPPDAPRPAPHPNQHTPRRDHVDPLNPEGLTDKQYAFCKEYMVDHNTMAAAGRAGYSDPNFGRQLLALPNVNAAITRMDRELEVKSNIEGSRIMREWACIGLSDMGDIVDFTGTDPRLKPANQIPEHARRAISSVKVKRYMEGHGEDARQVEVIEFKLWDKNTALDKMAHVIGLLQNTMHLRGTMEHTHQHEHFQKVIDSIPVGTRETLLLALTQQNQEPVPVLPAGLKELVLTCDEEKDDAYLEDQE